ncbi:hypothetical protein BYT27DRAFT_7121368 [Phlegmacium glaucopus]|nr:hypothetical protein BYT27DRAFT_7121368 [Phlegmacium glaucopus]
MGHESTVYLPLVSNPSSSEECSTQNKCRTTYYGLALREVVLLFVILIQAVALVVSMFTSSHDTKMSCMCPYSDRPLLCSPAQVALEHEVKSFTAGREKKTIYQGLSDDVDRAWGMLYNHTIMKITRSEAILLPNKTYPIKDQPGYYIAELDVFHQLHCLNNIRRALHREYYIKDTDLDEEHVSHCVDSIRQSLMCNADISVNVWQWDNDLSVVVGHSTQAHSCRNFNKLRDWALERRIHKWIDTRLFIEDDLPTPPVIS